MKGWCKPGLARALHCLALLVPVGAILAEVSRSGPSVLIVLACAPIIWFVALQRNSRGTCVWALVHGVGIAVAICSGIGLAVVALLDFWVADVALGSSRFFALAAGVLLVSASLEILGTLCDPRHRLLVVGTADEGLEVVRDLIRNPDLPFEYVGFVGGGHGNRARDGRYLGAPRELGEIVARARADLIVLADGPARAEALRYLLDVPPSKFRVIGLDQFYEHAFGRVPIERVSPAWFMGVLHLYQRQYSRISKRIFDLCFASIALGIAAPFLAVLALLVRLSGPGPIIFRQIRLGEGGHTFVMLKLRTMVSSAEDHEGPVWATEDDPRETRVGSLMRDTRLDELPQLWNVIRGEMSLVGPRPERPEFLTLLRREVPFWTSRHLVKPGITGWAQVRRGYTRDAGGAAEKLSYDLYYLRHRSVATDLAIIARTAGVVSAGFAAHCSYPQRLGRNRRASSSEPRYTRQSDGVLIPTASREGSAVPGGDTVLSTTQRRVEHDSQAPPS